MRRYLLLLPIAFFCLMLTTSGKKRSGKHPVVPIAKSAVTGLYADTASSFTGTATHEVEELPKYMLMRFSGVGAVSWKVKVPRAGDYEVAVCSATELGVGTKYEVVGSKNSLQGITYRTKGEFEQSEDDAIPPKERWWLVNFERVKMKGVLRLPAGTSTVTLRVVHPKKGHLWEVRSIELTPVNGKKAILKERERAIKSRASTDDFVKSGYGVMFHWTEESASRKKPQKEYQDAVRDFDVDDFIKQVKETGAGWVIFTVNHENPHCPAPIKSWKAAHRDWTTKRDLLGEIADGLSEEGIKLIFYMATHLIGKPDDVDEEDYMERMINLRFSSYFDEDRFVTILNEFGKRYGDKLAGYWFDGWDLIPEQYPGLDFEHMFKATKTGNQDRIICYNYWMFPDATMWQEYWGGEIEDPETYPKDRYMKYAAGEGMQWHGLLTLEEDWIRYDHGKKQKARIKASKLIPYIQKSMEIGGMVTINLGIYQEGIIPQEQLEVMKEVKKAIRK